jgi:hypothetical protein
MLQRNATAVRRIIAANMGLLLHATPPPAKKWSGHPRNVTPTQEERLCCYVFRFPIKTARELKKEGAVTLLPPTNRKRDIPTHTIHPQNILSTVTIFYCDTSTM